MASENNDTDRERKCSKRLSMLKRFISSPSKSRKAYPARLQANAVVAAPSNALAPINTASKTTDELIYHINTALYGEHCLSWAKYRHRIQEVPRSRLSPPDEGFTKFQPERDEWEAMTFAMKHSVAVFRKGANRYNHWINPEATTKHVKATGIGVEKLNGEDVIVVTIRGTTSLSDWFVNPDIDLAELPPQEPNAQVHDPTQRWHKGFLTSFQNIEKKVADAIYEILSHRYPPRRIIFTGHSAGGGIAQLCYNSCNDANTPIGRAVQGLTQIDCITFAAPPVSTVPISRHPGQGLLLAVINEGDPIVLAQAKYFKAVLTVLATPKNEWTAEGREKFTVPPLEFHVSGKCVVLRDINPASRTGEFEAVEVPFKELERVIFADFIVHGKDQYRYRVNILAEAALGQSSATLQVEENVEN